MKTALLAREVGVDPHKMRYVAFEGGGEPVTALLGNHIQAVSGDLSEMVPYLQGDKIRVLAVYSDQRLPGQLANVPTAKEQGFNLVWPIIRGFYVGPKVSEEEYQWWLDTFQKMMATDEFKKQRDLRGLFEFNLAGKELDAYVKNQVNQYREQAKVFGLAK
jgi:putative tricarboxylic transport membrane protein